MAGTPEKNIAAVTGNLYEILEPLESEDRKKAVAAAMMLLGESGIQAGSVDGDDADGGERNDDALDSNELRSVRAFFDAKDPQNKIEELAVAARYREQKEGAHEHTKDDLEKAAKDARRNFDSSNYSRDINNAKVKGLFTRGRENKLAYYGQEYVDTLPDRDALSQLRKPRTSGKKKARTKKKSFTKKTASKKKGTASHT